MERWPTSFLKNTFLGAWADPRGPFGSTVNMFWKSSFWPESTVTGWISKMASKFHVGPPYPPTLLADHIWGQLGNLSSRQIESNPSNFSFNPSRHSLRRVGRTAGVSVYLHTSMTSIEWLTVSHFCSAYICRTVTLTVCVCLIIKDNLLVLNSNFNLI